MFYLMKTMDWKMIDLLLKVISQHVKQIEQQIWLIEESLGTQTASTKWTYQIKQKNKVDLGSWVKKLIATNGGILGIPKFRKL